MTDEQSTDDGLEREFADVLGVLRRFESAAAPAGFEGRVEERVAMTLKQMKQIEPAPAPVEVREVAGISLRCAYCHAALARDEASFCAACLAPHHDECWVEHGRCTAPGCAETRVVRPREGALRPTGGKYRATRRWARALVVTAGLTGVLGIAMSARSWQIARQEVAAAREERALVEELQRLKAEGLKAYVDFNRNEKPRSLEADRALYDEAHTKLVRAMDLITKLLDRHRDPSTGFTPENYEGYEVDQSEVAEILVDLEKRVPSAHDVHPAPEPRLLDAAGLLAQAKQAATDGKVVEATRLLRRAVELDPTSAEARDLLARLHRIGDAVEQSTENLVRHPQVQAIEARLLLREGRLDEALNKAEQALRLDPTTALAYLVRAEVRVAQGRVDEAMADLHRAIELDPRHSGAFRLRGRLSMERGELDGGLEDLLHASALDPGGQEALDDFNTALELDPMRDGAWYGRARARALLGELRGALADLDRAIALNPAVPAYFSERGELRERLGDPDGARADAAHAAELRRPGEERKNRR
jgi:tetratricopeptide (TPR) repeat protein